MMDRKQIKAAAKGRMAQSSPSYWLVMLVWVGAAVVLPQLVLNLAGGSSEALQKLVQLLEGGIDPELALRALQLSAGQVASTWVLSIVLNLYQMVLGFGLSAYTLRLYRGQNCGAPDLFAGFSMVGRVIGQQIFVALIAIGLSILVTIPITMAAIYAMAMDAALGSIVLLVLCLGAVVLLMVVLLNYALATFALADRPDLGAMGAIQAGKNLIRGHKGKYVVLCLSFFGWAVLCALPQGIFMGIYTALVLPVPLWAANLIDVVLMLPYYLWLMPYMQTSIAGFYDALRQEKETLPPLPPL